MTLLYDNVSNLTLVAFGAMNSFCLQGPLYISVFYCDRAVRLEGLCMCVCLHRDLCVYIQCLWCVVTTMAMNQLVRQDIKIHSDLALCCSFAFYP